MISVTEMVGGSGACSRENFKMIDAIWCVFDASFDRLSFKM